MNCKAITKSGQQCKKSADDTGYCSIHREANFEKNDEKLILDNIYSVVIDTCERNNWYVYRETYDINKFRFFSVIVNKRVKSNLGLKNVEAELFFRVKSDMTLERRINNRTFENNGVKNLLDDIVDELQYEKITSSGNEKKKVGDENIEILTRIFKRFHISTLQLQKRYDNRASLEIKDEYDVQDYLHAILKMFFSDIRAEEYSPSRAGKNSRVDFLLKEEKIIIETKMSRPNLKDKKLGEELIIDIERYQEHPDCKKLICFVYDPGYIIKNPYGLEKDLSGLKNNLEVMVFIYPK